MSGHSGLRHILTAEMWCVLLLGEINEISWYRSGAGLGDDMMVEYPSP